MPTFFLYARKSTDSEERQVRSIEAQITELRLLAEKEGLTIKQEFTESMTAKVPGRPIFNKMMERIEKGEAQGIIAWHPDRLARNSVDGGRIVYLLDTKQIQGLKFPTFWFENTPQGKFMLNIAFGQSKYYVDNLSENVKRGNRQKLRRGEWPGRAPLGYINDKVTRKIVIDPMRGPLIAKLFRECATGKYPVTHLTALASEWGLKSRDPRNEGGKIANFYIEAILRNPTYYGLMRYNGEYHEGKHEPLISKDLFDRAQDALDNRTKNYSFREQPFPFLGLAKCDQCGCSITAERKKGHHYYRCTKKRGPCSSKYLREENLTDQLRAIVTKFALPAEAFQYLMAEWAYDQDLAAQPVAEVKAQMAQELPEIQAKIDRLLDLHLAGDIDRAHFQTKKAALLNRKVELEAKLKKLEAGDAAWLEPLQEHWAAAHKAYSVVSEGNLEALKETAKNGGSNFRLAAKRLQFDYNFPWRRLAATADFSNFQELWAM